MAFRLADALIVGELDNTRRYSTSGRLLLRGLETTVMVELTGDCDEDLRGKRFRFEPREPDAGKEMDLRGFALHQIGPTGTMTAARMVRTFDCPIEEFLERSKQGDQPPTEWKRCLYLEWYSQNGRVVIELADPIITLIDDEENERLSKQTSPLPTEVDEMDPPGEYGLGVTSISRDDEGDWHVKHEVFGGDEGDLVEGAPSRDGAADLERAFEREAREVDRAIRSDKDEADIADGDIIDELELMDDLIDRGGGEPVGVLFRHPERLPKPEALSDEKVERLLKSLLIEMALAGIALHVCEHFTPRDAYRLLIETIAKEDSFHPKLRGTGWVQNFATREYCAECEAEFEEEWEREHGAERGGQEGGEPGGIEEE